LPLEAKPQTISHDESSVLIGRFRIADDQLGSILTDEGQLSHALRSNEIVGFRLEAILAFLEQPFDQLRQLLEGLGVIANHLLENADVEVHVFLLLGRLHQPAHQQALRTRHDVADRTAHRVPVLVHSEIVQQLEEGGQNRLIADVPQSSHQDAAPA
jgi:hypothetical protein